MNTLSLSGNNTVLLSSSIPSDGSSIFTFVLEPETTITLIDDLYSHDALSLTFILKTNAQLLYRYRFTHEEQEKNNFVSRTHPQKAPSFSKTITVKLSEPGSKARIECIAETFNYDYCVFKTVQHHLAPHTESLVITRGVAHDNSRCLSENLIRIEKDAQHTKAREENKSLLLGEHARIISIPKLEVEADSVSCEHGAAIARLREEDLFYMQTRGIDQTKAQSILVDAFLTHTL